MARAPGFLDVLLSRLRVGVPVVCGISRAGLSIVAGMVVNDETSAN
jgi:hypothetical protein